MITLVRFTGFRDLHDAEPVPVWVNPLQIAYVCPYQHGQANARIFFAEDGVLELAETPAQILSHLGCPECEVCGEPGDNLHWVDVERARDELQGAVS